MSYFIDDDNVEEYHGGTLQLNNANNETTRQVSTATTLNSSAGSSSGVTGSLGVEQSAISSGYDFLSPAMSESPNHEINDGSRTNNIIIPQYNSPFGFENATDYFSYRNGMVETAIDECNSTLIFPNQDGEVIGSWLLTEISLWDNEKERLVTLTNKALITVKYDFIALKQMEFRKVNLEQIDTIAIGELVYPPASLVPRINGIANGVSSVVRDCIVDKFISSTAPREEYQSQAKQSSDEKLGPINLKNFEPSNRNMRGVRTMWNRGQPVPFTKKWNPFVKDIPMCTFSSHPLFWHKDTPDTSAKNLYNVDNFTEKLVETIESLQQDDNQFCKIIHAPIVMPNYVGITSLIHNKNSLGFFKVRVKEWGYCACSRCYGTYRDDASA